MKKNIFFSLFLFFSVAASAQTTNADKSSTVKTEKGTIEITVVAIPFYEGTNPEIVSENYHRAVSTDDGSTSIQSAVDITIAAKKYDEPFVNPVKKEVIQDTRNRAHRSSITSQKTIEMKAAAIERK